MAKLLLHFSFSCGKSRPSREGGVLARLVFLGKFQKAGKSGYNPMRTG
jgi:hypothetical protein